jgi:hypothetical protein
VVKETNEPRVIVLMTGVDHLPASAGISPAKGDLSPISFHTPTEAFAGDSFKYLLSDRGMQEMR